MKLSCKTILHPTKEQKLILDSYAFATAKLWNVGNYEKHNFETLGFDTFPNWYDQKKRLKNHYWFKSVPSQTAQETLNRLHQAWKSFFELKRTGGINNPKPPYYKKGLHSFAILNNGFKQKGNTFIITLSKQQKSFLNTTHNLKEKCFTIEIPRFQNLSDIKQLCFYPRKNGTYQIIAVYEIPDVITIPDNSRYLSIDPGVNNLATCFDSDGFSFIISGSQYLNACHYYNKEIAKLQSILDKSEPERKWISPRMVRLFAKRKNTIDDVLHKATRLITNYCLANEINTVILGDLTGIRKDKNFGNKTNQTFHGLPYLQFFKLLSYKLAQHGLTLTHQKEYYSSQCPPNSKHVSKRYAVPANSKKRGCYHDGNIIYNADAVGAFNILRLYLHSIKSPLTFKPIGLSNPTKVSV